MNEIIKKYKLSGKHFFLPLAASRDLSACIVYLSVIRITNQLTFWHLIQYRKLCDISRS